MVSPLANLMLPVRRVTVKMLYIQSSILCARCIVNIYVG
jgi:hypothetical protein